MKQVPLIDDGHAAQLERDRGYELDRTPGPVCRQGLDWGIATACSMIGQLPRMMIDIGAGSGVFGQQLATIFHPGEDGPIRVAIEPRVEERPHLARHYECFHLNSFSVTLMQWGGMPRDAWVACNPAFSIFPDIVRACAPVCTATLLYGSIAWGCSEAGAELFAAHPPVACARIIGRVNHRGPGINPATISKDCPNGKPWAADQRDNCWWLWMRDEAPDRWTTENLPLLPPEQRRWTIPPGQEP